MKESLRISKESVDLARKEFISTHRPKLVVRRISLNEVNGAGVWNIIAAEYVIANVGDSTATIVSTSERLWLPTAKENLPSIPPYAEPVTHSLILEAGLSLVFKHYATDDDLLKKYQQSSAYTDSSISEGRTDSGPELLFLGYIVYKDDLDRKRKTAFLRRSNYITKRFSPIKEPDYEYAD